MTNQRITLEGLKDRLPSCVVIDESTYVNSYTPARFIDAEYGEWFARPNKVWIGQSHPMRTVQKRKQTMLNRYGADQTMKIPHLRDKVARSSAETVVLTHWNTQQPVYCVGTYEVFLVSYWNTRKVNFEWQIPFAMPDGRVYIVDAYLPDSNLYIEIKGLLRGDALEKWEWFHSCYPNSEMWRQDKLKEMGYKYSDYADISSEATRREVWFLRHKDMVGKVFNSLTVMSPAESDKFRPDGRLCGYYWHCKCECGNECDVEHYRLVKLKHKSCGCAVKQALSNNRIQPIVSGFWVYGIEDGECYGLVKDAAEHFAVSTVTIHNWAKRQYLVRIDGVRHWAKQEG